MHATKKKKAATLGMSCAGHPYAKMTQKLKNKVLFNGFFCITSIIQHCDSEIKMSYSNLQNNNN